MMVKAAPRLATILCRWFGRLAMPIGEALSAVAGAMVGGGLAEFNVDGVVEFCQWAVKTRTDVEAVNYRK